jgi:hypothetical protein
MAESNSGSGSGSGSGEATYEQDQSIVTSQVVYLSFVAVVGTVANLIVIFRGLRYKSGHASSTGSHRSAALDTTNHQRFRLAFSYFHRTFQIHQSTISLVALFGHFESFLLPSRVIPLPSLPLVAISSSSDHFETPGCSLHQLVTTLLSGFSAIFCSLFHLLQHTGLSAWTELGYATLTGNQPRHKGHTSRS